MHTLVPYPYMLNEYALMELHVYPRLIAIPVIPTAYLESGAQEARYMYGFVQPILTSQ